MMREGEDASVVHLEPSEMDGLELASAKATASFMRIPVISDTLVTVATHITAALPTPTAKG